MLILASNSPRRKQLLALGDWPFLVRPVDIDESLLPGEPPDQYVLRLSKEKALAARRLFSHELSAAELILAADTAVAIKTDTGVAEDERANTPAGSRILGKPANYTEAEAMLSALRGKTHQVYTGLAILRADDGRLVTDVTVTDVCMREYSDAEMQAYIASGDPFDKAGAYAIQHAGFHPVQELHGCYANVMGLPVCRLARLLEEFNLPVKSDLVAACERTLNAPCPILRQVK